MPKATIANGTNGIEPTGAIHLTLQGKGGVGKSLVASVLAQYLKEQGKDVRCIDTDPVNRTFAQYSALGADRLKPQGPGLDTNLLITTDRRAYYLRLLSKPDDYVARVAFAYPDDEENEHKWQQHLAEQKDQQNKATRIAELPPNSVESMYFNYRLKGDDRIRPVRVFDDGKKTYIQISEAAKNREAPVLVVIGADGKQEMVNYRVKDDMYIIDRLFEKAELILGSGKKARKVEIDRERKS
jgi:P-type conjugative transfer protein TrbG